VKIIWANNSDLIEMINKRGVICFLAFFLLANIFSFNAFSQDTPKKKKNPNKYEWGNMGLGFGLTDLKSDVTTNSYGVDYNRKLGLIFLQGAIYGGLNQDYPSLFGMHIAAGYAIGYHKPVMIAMSIGPGYYAGDNNELKSYRALGGNGTVQMLFKPVSDIGIGAELFFNYPFAANIGNLPSSNGIRIVLTISTK